MRGRAEEIALLLHKSAPKSWLAVILHDPHDPNAICYEVGDTITISVDTEYWSPLPPGSKISLEYVV